MEQKILEKLLKKMEYSKKNGENVWFKQYKDLNLIEIDFAQKKISYGEINVGRKTILNFAKDENFVVLECVNRLLEKGYKSKNILLEQDCGDSKDYIDIIINDEKNKAFSIIECKTYGKEFKKAENDAKSKGKQIFRYAVQDNNLKYVILYTSQIIGESIVYDSRIIDLAKYNFSNRSELFDVWDKTFESKGFFEEDILPYNIEFRGIIKKDLKPIDFFDTNITDKSLYTGTIYNQFSEILRRHTVSDKNNAYNKMFNLFLCKIVDEDEKKENEEMDFQWKEGESGEEVLLRLNDLYKKGIKEYLDIAITDYTEKEIEEVIQRNIEPELRKLFVELRLYKNNEFSFKEVFNKQTFDENCEVIKEVVKLFENKKIKSIGKQQFLGDFFEKLLNLGIKQEAGQFFTPVPLTDFIVKSIPVKKIIEDKLEKRETNYLPYIIDYACGAGHFLTEIMKEVDKYLYNINEENLTEKQKENYISWKNNYRWADEFLYGIEKDYRLAKTSKIACFVNGDGLANVICADGLESFTSSKYRGMLKTNNEGRNNNQFDIVVANPPYSVDGFKNATENIEKNFELGKYVTEESKEIECLFVERTNQLLKENGIAAIILPLTFLTSPDKTYAKAREILVNNFDILSIVTLGTEAFMATEMKTAILFLKKKITNIDSNREYVLTCNLDFQKDKKLERRLLGYEFSERKGKEGITIHDGGILQNFADLEDNNKLKWYIQCIYNDPEKITELFENGKLLDQNKQISKYLKLSKINDVINKENGFTIDINQVNYEIPKFKVKTTSLSKILFEPPISGKRPKGGVSRIENGVLSLGGRQLNEFGEITLAKPEYITEEFYKTKIDKKMVIKNNDILMCKDGARTGKVAVAENIENIMTINEHVFIIRVNSKINYKYLFYYLYSKLGQKVLEPLKTRGGQGGINQTKLSQMIVPIVEKNIEDIIIKKCDEIMKTARDGEKVNLVTKVLNKYLI